MMKLIVGLVCFVLSISIAGQELMTIEKAISIGLEKNLQIKIDEANVKIAENNNTWARAGKGPVVDLNGSLAITAANDNNRLSFSSGKSLLSNIGGSLDANWLVLSGGRVGIVKDQLELGVSQQTQLQSLNTHNVIRDIIQAYFNVLLEQERNTVLQDVFQVSKDRLAYEAVKKEFGTSNSFNMIQFENAVLSDSVNLVSQKNLIDIAKRNLNLLLTLPSDENYDFPERLSVELEELDRDKLLQLLDEENPGLKSLAIISELNTLNASLEETSRKPSLSLFGSLGLTENYFNLFQNSATIGQGFDAAAFSNRIGLTLGANLNWNIYDGGVTSANVENAKMQQVINQLDIVQTKLNLHNQLDILIQNYNNQKTILTLSDAQLNIADRNLVMAEERFKLGQITSLDYRAIQNQYLNVAFTKVSAIYNLNITKSEIDWVVGVFK